MSKTIKNKKTEGALTPELKKKLLSLKTKEFTDPIAPFNLRVAELTASGCKGDITKLAVNYVIALACKKATRNANFRNKAVQFEGFVIGKERTWDKVQMMIDKAQAVYEEKGLDVAISEGLMDENETYLDTRATVFGKANPNYRKSLYQEVNGKLKLIEDTSKKIYVFAKIEGDSEYRVLPLQTSSKVLAKAWEDVPLYKTCTSYANVKYDDNKVPVSMSSSMAEDTRTVFKAKKLEDDIETLFLNKVMQESTKLSDVELVHKTTPEKERYNTIVYISGIVAEIASKPTQFGQRFIWVTSEEEWETKIKLVIPEGIKVNFGIGSEIIAYGKTRDFSYVSKKGEAVDGGIGLDVIGLQVIQAVDVGLSTSGTDDEETEDEEIEAWVE